MADLLRAGCLRSRAEMLIRERANMTRKGPLAKMLLVERILVALYAGLPALRKKRTVKSAKLPMYLRQRHLLAAAICNSALNPLCNIWAVSRVKCNTSRITEQELGPWG